jgi:hypothetical protein
LKSEDQEVDVANAADLELLQNPVLIAQLQPEYDLHWITDASSLASLFS